MNFAAETSQPVVPQSASHVIPIINTLDKNCGIFIPTTRFRGTPNITHWSIYEDALVQLTVVGDTVADYRKENYKFDFEVWDKNYKPQSECKNIEMSQAPLY